MKFVLSVLVSVIVFTACSQKKSAADNVTSLFHAGEKLAELKNPRLEEVSGLAASIQNPGLLWTHNDSGNGTEVYLVDKKLNIKFTCTLRGIENRDWEDITVGPGPDSSKTYIYVAEIGDNDAKYPLKYIYRFEEPVVKPGADKMDITSFETITFRLPQQQKDTESLLLDPQTKNLYIVSKREKPVYVYELKYPQSTLDTITATEIASLPLTQIVAGDFSADGREILMKNYEHIYWWPNTENKSVAEVLKEKPLEIPYEIEPQGESITWDRDGSGFYTISEKNKGKHSYLFFYKRK